MRIPAVAVVVLCLGVLVGCGMEGEPGPVGPPGPQGEQGPPGTGGAILAAYTACSTTVAIGSSVLSLIHQRYEYADGSVSTACEVRDGAHGYQGGFMFLPGQQGAALGVCHVSYDVDASTYARWEFTLRSADTSSSAVYADRESVQNGFRATLDCQRFP